jgi:hypothetical protein
MPELHLQGEHILLETMSVQHLEEGRIARADVLEHLLHPETILQFERFVDFIGHASATGQPKFVERWMEQFKGYCEKEKQNALQR